MIAGNAYGIGVYGAREATLSTPRYIFEPPTYERAFDWPLLTHGPRFHLDQAMSVVRMGGALRTVSAPSQDQLVAAGVEGVDWFRGGHIYHVSQAVADDLSANGFTVAIDHEG